MSEAPSKSIETRTIVVTGGADGIGRAVVLLCAARRDNVAILDKNAEAAKKTAAEAMKQGAKCALSLACDVSSEKQIEKAFEIVSNKIGAPYGLFTGAGIDLGGLVHELPAATWRRVLDTNLTGTFFACKHAIRKIDRKSTRLNSSHPSISYAVFCLKKKNQNAHLLVREENIDYIMLNVSNIEYLLIALRCLLSCQFDLAIVPCRQLVVLPLRPLAAQ